VKTVTAVFAELLRRLIVVVPVERRDWAEAAVRELAHVPEGRARLSWLLGACWLVIREAVVIRRVVRTAGFVGHLGAGTAAVWAVVVVTGGVSYAPLRQVMIVLAVVVAVLSLLGWAPRVLGPVADDPASRVVRATGLLLAGLAVWGVVVEFWFNGDPSQVNPAVADRASLDVPFLTVMFAIYLAAFLVATRRGSVLGGRTLMHSTAVAFAAVALWVGGAILIPAAGATFGMMLMGAAFISAAVLASRRGDVLPTASLAGLLAAMMTAQIMLSVADVMFHLGPDAWIPDAGPGPLTPQAHLAQNRVEAIDPYTSVLFCGALAALTLVIVTFVPRVPDPVELAESTTPA
jgi:hypothetical protein